MTLETGSRLGHYEVLGPLGVGGMGEVYRARDGKLGRDVALKVLPERLARDVGASARFEREARAVAALSHPNILAIHDFGHDEGTGTSYAVMELLEGETLRARLADGALPFRKALELARAIAQGLAAAHEMGIVHRDLKPENLFVTRGGHIKILDFGLAKQATSSTPSDTRSPTMATEPGVVRGTVGYMSPEQVRGHSADARSDIFSFGAVLFEMLSGRRPFQRATAAETMAAILRDEPTELTNASGPLPPALERIVRHCLEKEPDERFRSAHDLAFALDAVAGSSIPTGPHPHVGRPERRVRRVAAIALAAAGVIVGFLAARASSRPKVGGVIAIRPLGSSGTDREPAVSPDGRTLAFSSDRDGTQRIWLKQLPAGAEVALTSGSDSSPRYSPDGTQILFVRTRKAPQRGMDIFRVPALGGEPRRVVPWGSSAEFSPDGKSVVAAAPMGDGQGTPSRLLSVPLEGGTPREIARSPGRELANPRFSPDGRTIAVVSSPAVGTQARRFDLVDVAGKGSTPLEPGPSLGGLSNVLWLEGGREVLYVQGLTLLQGSSMLFRQEVTARVARPLLWVPWEGGTLDRLPGGSLVSDTLVRRQNLYEIALGAAEASRWLTRGTDSNRQPAFSPDGEWIAYSVNHGGNLDIWERSVKTGALRRLTEDPGDDWDPGFMPDGRLVFSSGRSGHLEIWLADADGGSPRRLTDDGVDAENPTGTSDGWVVYSSANPKMSGVWKIRVDGSSATLLFPGPNNVPDVSPDGKYVAFVNSRLSRSNEEASKLKVVRIADGVVVPFSISLQGKRPSETLVGRPRWMPNGRALAFIDQDETGINGVFVQDFDPERSDTTATRRKLGGFRADVETESYGISPDGKTLVVSGVERLVGMVTLEGIPGLGTPARK